MTENNVNVPLLRKAVEWAEAEAVKPPDLREWEQNWWVLKPEHRACRVADVDQFGEDWWGPRENEAFRKAPECGTTYCIAGFVAAQEGYEGEGFGCAEIAADALRIDFDGVDERGGLFYYDNTIEDVRRIAESLAGERL